MNDRIKELAEQAVQLVANDCTKGDISRLNTDSFLVKDLIDQKFAELIVLECAAFVSGSAEVYTQAEQDACVRAGKGLKNYFGIE